MKPMLIRGGRLIDPGQDLDRTGDLLLADGKIAWRGEGALPPDYDVLPAEGLVVCPGFIDLHCHLRQPGFEESETIATGTRAAARGGFTTVCAMPNTQPPPDSEAALNYVRTIAAQEGVIRVLPVGCVTRGRQGKELADMGELEVAGAVAYSDDGDPVGDAQVMRQALEYSAAFGLPIINHCEDRAASAGGQVNEGVVSLELGLPGIPPAAEESMVARDLALAAETGGHVHIAHVSTGGSVDLIREAKTRGVPVTAEVTPHHLTLTEAAVLVSGASAKVSPPLRTRRDNEALLRGLNDGVIDIVATDHAPHATAAKNGDFNRAACGISGLETALGSLVGLIYDSDLSLNTLVAALTTGPARVLGYEKLGTLETGAPADVTVFDLHQEWVVRPEEFASLGKNTPLAGATLRGKVMATIYGGRAVYTDDSMKIETRE